MFLLFVSLFCPWPKKGWRAPGWQRWMSNVKVTIRYFCHTKKHSCRNILCKLSSCIAYTYSGQVSKCNYHWPRNSAIVSFIFHGSPGSLENTKHNCETPMVT